LEGSTTRVAKTRSTKWCEMPIPDLPLAEGEDIVWTAWKHADVS